MMRREWVIGNIPVVYYPAQAIETATFKVDESYPDEAILEVAPLPKESAKIKPQIFLGFEEGGEPLARELFVLRAAPGGAERSRLMLASAGSASAHADASRAKTLKRPPTAAETPDPARPHRWPGGCRRPASGGALKVGVLLAAAAAALVSIFFWNTATVVETPLHGKADLYVPPIPVEIARGAPRGDRDGGALRRDGRGGSTPSARTSSSGRT